MSGLYISDKKLTYKNIFSMELCWFPLSEDNTSDGSWLNLEMTAVNENVILREDVYSALV